MSLRDFAAAPAAQSVRLINFDSCEVVAGTAGGYFLIVRGEAPCINMRVRLSPRIYIECPEYWGIEVVGSLPGGICLTAIQPYSLAISLDGITGSKGIEVIGARKSEQIDVEGGCEPGGTCA